MRKVRTIPKTKCAQKHIKSNKTKPEIDTFTDYDFNILSKEYDVFMFQKGVRQMYAAKRAARHIKYLAGKCVATAERDRNYKLLKKLESIKELRQIYDCTYDKVEKSLQRAPSLPSLSYIVQLDDRDKDDWLKFYDIK